MYGAKRTDGGCSQRGADDVRSDGDLYKHKVVIIIVSVIAFTALIVILWYALMNKDKHFEWNQTPNNIYSDTIVMAADIDYPPFSFIDANGPYNLRRRRV